jgi:hypothetical protein
MQKPVKKKATKSQLTRVFADQKAGQTRKNNNESVKVTLPTLKFLEKKIS